MGSGGTENPLSGYPEFFNNYQGVFFSILMPFIAVGTWIVFLDYRKHNYTEHLVINLYTTAQMIFFNFIIYTLCALFNLSNQLVISLVSSPILILYGAFIFKRIYPLSFINVLIRYVAAHIIYITFHGNYCNSFSHRLAIFIFLRKIKPIMNYKNCHTELHVQDDYCKSCGGKVIRKRLSFKNLFEHLSETFFNYDNKLLRTFVQLFKNSEDVIVGYINGVRKRYINPISFFGLALTLSGLSVFILKKFYIEHLDFSHLFEGVKASQDIFNATSGNILEYNSLFYSFLIPLMALVSRVIFLDKKFNFTEHIIIYLYSMSLLSIISVIIGQIVLFLVPSNYLLFSMSSWLIMLVYLCYALKRIFKLSIGNLILKTIIAVALFFMAYMIISILAFILMLITGVVSLEDFRPK